MADAGYTEIQLLGQNVNSYKDPSRQKTFAELLHAVATLPGIRRVRFTTSHPRDFTKDIVDVIDATPTLCDHIHLPVQSGSTAILKAMAREYTRDWYLERIAWIKAAKRDLSITSDIIVGFPGETDEDLEQTATLLDEVQYDAIFAFKYSGRPNTPAISMADSISDDEKARRLQILLDRQREIQRVPLRPPSRPDHGPHDRRPQHRTQPGHRTQHPEQDRQLHHHPAHPPRARQLPDRPDHPDLSQQPRGGSGLTTIEELTPDIEVQIRGLMLDPVTNMPIVILKDIESDLVLPIWVGVFEANAIALELEKDRHPPPHDARPPA